MSRLLGFLLLFIFWEIVSFPKSITPEELKEKLRLHGLWLKDEEGGVRLILNGVDLSYANLNCYVF